MKPRPRVRRAAPRRRRAKGRKSAWTKRNAQQPSTQGSGRNRKSASGRPWRRSTARAFSRCSVTASACRSWSAVSDVGSPVRAESCSPSSFQARTRGLHHQRHKLKAFGRAQSLCVQMRALAGLVVPSWLSCIRDDGSQGARLHPRSHSQVKGRWPVDAPTANPNISGSAAATPPPRPRGLHGHPGVAAGGQAFQPRSPSRRS